MMAMPNQYANASLTEQVRQHGEILARLSALFEEDHKDLDALKKSTELIAKVVAAQEERELANDKLRTKIKDVVIPIVAVIIGAIATHFIH